MKRRTLIPFLAAAVLAVAAPSAVAGSATSSGYAGPAGNSQVDVGTPTSASGTAGVTAKPASDSTGPAASQSTSPASSGSLPFTGLDLGLVVGAGAVLLALGLALRRGVTAERPH